MLSNEKGGIIWGVNESNQNKHMTGSPPPDWQGWLELLEVAQADAQCEQLFHKTFGQQPPRWGRHIVVRYTDSLGDIRLLSYLHFWQRDRAGYIGGGCTDGDVVRAMAPKKRLQFSKSGGALFHTLRFAFTHFHTDIDAFFGLAENPRAREVDLAAGFEDAGVGNLLIRETRPLQESQRQALIKQALAVGNF